MQRPMIFPCILSLLTFLTFALPTHQAIANSSQSRSICSRCHCTSKFPYQVNCSDLGLTDLLIDLWPTDPDIDAVAVNYDHNNIQNLRVFSPKLNITSLSLRYNNLKNLDHKIFQHMRHIDSIDLSYNQLDVASITKELFWSSDVSNYNRLPLLILKLANNKIHSLNSDVFAHVPSLQVLDLTGNPLKMIDTPLAIAISHLRDMRELYLADCQLTMFPDTLPHSLHRLETLDLSSNNFTKVPKAISHSHRLDVLKLNNNPIEVLNETDFEGLTDLTELYLSGMPKLKTIGARIFTPLKSISMLELAYNKQLEKINVEAFESMEHDLMGFTLRTLNLRGNNLSHIPHALLPWRYIDVLDIQENPFKCDCHIEWMHDVLLKQIEKRTPDLAGNIMCATPEKYKGHGLAAITSEPELLSCEEHDDYTIIQEVRMVTATAVIILMMGVVLTVIGAGALTMFVIKRQRLRTLYPNASEIRYVRAQSDEDLFSARDRHSKIVKVHVIEPSVHN